MSHKTAEKTANPEYNMVVAGLQDLMLVQERFLLLSGVLEYVPVRADMDEKQREKLKVDWEFQKGRVNALEMVSNRLIWQMLSQLDQNASSPIDSLADLPPPNIASLEKFQKMDLLEALWSIISKAHGSLELLLQYLEGNEKALLENEYCSLLEFEKYFLRRFCELKGRTPIFVAFDFEPDSLPIKEVDDSLLPLLLNSIRTIEQNSQDDLLKYFDFGMEPGDELQYRFPKLDEKKREYAREMLYLSKERDYDLMLYYMSLIARSPKEPLLPFHEIKIDRELTGIHEYLKGYSGKPFLFAFQKLVRIRARGYMKRMVWIAILSSCSRSNMPSVKKWAKRRNERSELEESVMNAFIASSQEYSLT